MSVDSTSWKDVTWEDYLEMCDSKKLYERYKDEWIKDHISDEVMTATEALYENDEDARDLTLTEYVDEFGYSDGSGCPCYDEFMDNEFEVWALSEAIEQYLYERGEYEYSEDRLPWIDEKADGARTEANIRTALYDNPEELLDYFKRECEALNPEDELVAKAKMLIGVVKEYCPEAEKEKAAKPVERD